ncbi:O-antigen ligase family protein [Flavobacterium sp. LM4]|uniref:O-antigen ligase family protein n=1 Tax=Flavobacterium sp. LM4 TaxID=1938609 RepID=UPI000F4F0812|nr:O-antigen ligase family protein [Flavobacterium sp. LM4]
MLNKPFSFVALNLFFFAADMVFLGGNYAFYLSVFFSVFIFIYNFRTFGIKESIVLSIIYLLAFDSPSFCFFQYNFRFWYFYLLLIYFIAVFQAVNNKDEILQKCKKNISLNVLIIIVFFIWSFLFFVIENKISKLYNFKYWFFYVGLILILNVFFKNNINKFKEISLYYISITFFVMVFGLLKTLNNIYSIPFNQISFFNIRPVAFYSETSWYSEFILFGLLFVFLLLKSKYKLNNFFYLVPFFLLGILFSFTRNSFLGFVLFLIISFVTDCFILKKRYIKPKNVKVILLTFSFILFVSLLLFFYLPNIFSIFILKLSAKDPSALGRIDAFKISIHNILNQNFFGEGFYWNSGYSTVTGSALGSKSFNLFLMIGNIFGIPGLILFLALIFLYLKKLMKSFFITKSIYIQYSIIVIIVFLQMAMFAPIHQFPFGMLIVSLSYFLYKKGMYNYQTLLD